MSYRNRKIPFATISDMLHCFIETVHENVVLNRKSEKGIILITKVARFEMNGFYVKQQATRFSFEALLRLIDGRIEASAVHLHTLKATKSILSNN